MFSFKVLVLLLPSLLLLAAQQTVVTIGLLQNRNGYANRNSDAEFIACQFAAGDASASILKPFNVTLNLTRFVMTADDAQNGAIGATTFYSQGVRLFLGAEQAGSCSSAAAISAYYKIPLVSPTGCTSATFSDKIQFPTLLRFYGSSTMLQLIIATLKRFQATAVQPVISSDLKDTFTNAGVALAQQGIAMQSLLFLDDSTTPDSARLIARQIKANGFRWILIIADNAPARELLIQMDAEGMNKDYAVLQRGVVPTLLVDPADTPERNAAAVRSFEGVITMSVVVNFQNPQYLNFVARLNATMCAKGNCVNDQINLVEGNAYLTPPAIFYDSVMMYALALVKVFNVTSPSVNLGLVGTQVLTALKAPYSGLTGIRVFAPNGDQLSDFYFTNTQNRQQVPFAFIRPATTGTTFDNTVTLKFRGGMMTPPPTFRVFECGLGMFGPGGVNCFPCAAGQFSNTTTASACSLCPQGTYQATPASSACVACPAGFSNANQGEAVCTACDIGKYTPVNGSLSCASCPSFSNNFQPMLLAAQGRLKTFVANNLADCVCIPGYWGDALTTCKSCDPQSSYCCNCAEPIDQVTDNLRGLGYPCAQCISGSQIPTPKKGYLLSLPDNQHGETRPKSVQGPVIIQCHIPQACFGGPNNECEVGYSGIRCGTCEEGFSNQGSDGCQQCPPPPKAKVLFCIMVLTPIAITIVVLEMSSRKASLGALAIVNYLIDSLFLISQIQFVWPSSTQYVFRIVSFLNFDSQLFFPDCSDAGKFLRSESGDLGLTLALPLIFIAVHLVLFGVILLIRMVVKGSKPDVPMGKLRVYQPRLYYLLFCSVHDIQCKFVSSFVRLMILLFPQMTSKSFLFLKCIQMADGTSRSFLLPSYDCGSPEWRSLLWMPVLGLLCYTVAFPLLTCLSMYKVRDSLIARQGSGFEILWPLTLEYREQVYYWGLVELIHLACILACITFFERPYEQAAATIFFLVIHFLWCMRARPYRTHVENITQAVLGTGLVVVVCLGIVGQANDDALTKTGTMTIVDIILIYALSFALLLFHVRESIAHRRKVRPTLDSLEEDAAKNSDQATTPNRRQFISSPASEDEDRSAYGSPTSKPLLFIREDSSLTMPVDNESVSNEQDRSTIELVTMRD